MGDDGQADASARTGGAEKDGLAAMAILAVTVVIIAIVIITLVS